MLCYKAVAFSDGGLTKILCSSPEYIIPHFNFFASERAQCCSLELIVHRVQGGQLRQDVHRHPVLNFHENS